MPVLMMLTREVRRVPLAWQHPRNERGHHVPLLSDFGARFEEWVTEKAKWDAGERPDYCSPENRSLSYEEWDGPQPDHRNYMPTFPAGLPMAVCMYETTTEGTPISGVFPDSDEGRRALAESLAKYGVDGLSVEQWAQIIGGGFGLKDVHTDETEVHGV